MVIWSSDKLMMLHCRGSTTTEVTESTDGETIPDRINGMGRRGLRGAPCRIQTGQLHWQLCSPRSPSARQDAQGQYFHVGMGYRRLINSRSRCECGTSSSSTSSSIASVVIITFSTMVRTNAMSLGRPASNLLTARSGGERQSPTLPYVAGLFTSRNRDRHLLGRIAVSGPTPWT